MPDQVNIDAHEIVGVVDAITKASQPKPAQLMAVIAKGAQNIKKDAARRISGLKHAPAYPRSIGYDLHQSLRGPSAIIGPDKASRQGSLGNLLEYGSVKNPPHPHLGPAGEAEQPRFAKALEDLAVKALGFE